MTPNKQVVFATRRDSSLKDSQSTTEKSFAKKALNYVATGVFCAASILGIGQTLKHSLVQEDKGLVSQNVSSSVNSFPGQYSLENSLVAFGNIHSFVEYNHLVDTKIDSLVHEQIHDFIGNKNDLEILLSRLSSLETHIDFAYSKQGVECNLTKGIISVESSALPGKISSKGAGGYVQFMKETALEEGVIIDDYIDGRFQPQSIVNGVAYFAKQEQRFESKILGLWAYNRGPSAVYNSTVMHDSSDPDILYRFQPQETKNYAVKVLAYEWIYDHEKELNLEVKQSPVDYQIHVVQAGDSMFDISQRAGVSLDEIHNSNRGLKSLDKIREGMEINIVSPID